MTLSAQVRQNMEVIGADGVHIGTVDSVRGDRIYLLRSDAGLGSHRGHHHSLPISLIATLEEDRVRLSAVASIALQFLEEEHSHGEHSADKNSTAALERERIRDRITLRDGAELYFKDWGRGQPILFHHGWPLTSDDWDLQMMFFLERGYRVIAHDRRGHGRSTQTDTGNDMDTYADDLDELVNALDLENVIHVGHSTGGGEVIRFLARHGTRRAAKAIIIGAIPPVMIRSESNPGGVPIEVFDQFRASILANRGQFYREVPIPFFGYNREDFSLPDVYKDNWWRQGMMGGIKAQYDSVRVFSETDFTSDLPKIDVPLLIMHGDDDQVVPIATSALLSAKLAPQATLKIYPGLPHGMATTHADLINGDILAFIRTEEPSLGNLDNQEPQLAAAQ